VVGVAVGAGVEALGARLHVHPVEQLPARSRVLQFRRAQHRVRQWRSAVTARQRRQRQRVPRRGVRARAGVVVAR